MAKKEQRAPLVSLPIKANRKRASKQRETTKQKENAPPKWHKLLEKLRDANIDYETGLNGKLTLLLKCVIVLTPKENLDKLNIEPIPMPLSSAEQVVDVDQQYNIIQLFDQFGV